MRGRDKKLIAQAKERHRKGIDAHSIHVRAVLDRLATNRPIITIPRESYTDAPDLTGEASGNASPLGDGINKTAHAILARMAASEPFIRQGQHALEQLAMYGQVTISHDIDYGITVHGPRRCLCCGGWEWEVTH